MTVSAPRIELVFLLSLMVLSSASCSVVQKYKCNNADWLSLGAEDGRSGLSSNAAFGNHANSCISVGAEVDKERYMVGHAQGLGEYCTSDNGLDEAKQGSPYQNVCPSDSEPEFLIGYETGLKEFCTKDSGFATGSGASEYHGVCPLEVRQEFLHGYVAGLDASRPRLDSQISELALTVGLLDAQTRDMNNRVRQLGTLESKAEKAGQSSLADFYGDEQSTARSDGFLLNSRLQSSEARLARLRAQRNSVDAWSLTWKALLQ